MAASSGLRPKEVDEMPPSDVWIMIEGHEQNLRNYWEMTRSIAFNVAKFGNSDPKKMARMTPQKFWPFTTDKKAIVNNDIWKNHEKMVARREQLMKKQKPK